MGTQLGCHERCSMIVLHCSQPAPLMCPATAALPPVPIPIDLVKPRCCCGCDDLQKDEKDALADSVRGDVVQLLLPLVDNFELARTQVRSTLQCDVQSVCA